MGGYFVNFNLLRKKFLNEKSNTTQLFDYTFYLK